MFARCFRGIFAASFATLTFVALAGGCSSDPDPSCVGVSCAPRICGTSCTASCGCCECADGEAFQQGGVSYVCHGGCYDLIVSDAGSDSASDATGD